MKIDLKQFTGPCSCGRTHAVTVQGIYIETDATRYLEEILRAYHHPVIICDSNTKRAAASKLNDYYQTLMRLSKLFQLQTLLRSDR